MSDDWIPMQFSLRSGLLFMTGVAIVTVDVTTGVLAIRFASPLLLALVGAWMGRSGYWRSCVTAGLASSTAMWAGLIRDAFLLTEEVDLRAPSAIWISYPDFARETFLEHFIVLTVFGAMLGLVVASTIWAISLLARRLCGAGDQVSLL